MLPDFQLEATSMIVNRQLCLNHSFPAEEGDPISNADIEQKYEDVCSDASEEVADDEDEIDIDDALVAFIKDKPVLGIRHSARLQENSSQMMDHRIASLFYCNRMYCKKQLTITDYLFVCLQQFYPI